MMVVVAVPLVVASEHKEATILKLIVMQFTVKQH